MTGPGLGKIPIQGVVNLVMNGEIIKLEPCDIYIHVKGYSRARVTHVDIESPKLDIRSYSEGVYAYVYGLTKGFKLILKKPLKISDKYVKEIIVKWDGPKILEVGKSSIAYIGFKDGGIYVGFKKDVIRKLENFGRSMGVIPR